jgi:Fe2+ transport system protein FeoA
VLNSLEVYYAKQEFHSTNTLISFLMKRVKKMTQLDKLKIGQSAIIQEMSIDCPHTMQLLSFGVLPGDTVEVTGKVLLGGPITLKHSNNTFFALRKSHAAQIEVKVVE